MCTCAGEGTIASHNKNPSFYVWQGWSTCCHSDNVLVLCHRQALPAASHQGPFPKLWVLMWCLHLAQNYSLPVTLGQMPVLGKDFVQLYMSIMKSLHKTLLKSQLPTPDLLSPETVSCQLQAFKIIKGWEGVCGGAGRIL